ncbi:trypsin-like peptidase domain-containing protein [Aliiglaciecola sp. LCG003]|uniref:trypsin-like peptidase domain-containing protein n=1 Tax=Aliiglaciecola sp. LCG003 TaxID=3053655 RepID=UPI002574802C|nr:trypsin-like peptidase domain-containing protein [Aliiglaciecola sp. LCG003]WJG08852.1 trypsin-like peptidase domain-containing protein [Aliiglaciecola sp. LCG003]
MSALILALVPELRKGSGLSLDVFSQNNHAPEKLSYYDAISRSAPAVVNIYSSSIDIVRRRQVNRTSLGSGVIMTENGYILTCWHVIKNAEMTVVGLPDGRRLPAELAGYDELTDLAVLKITADNLQVIPQLEAPEIRVGDVVLAIGNPLNIGQTITQGIVSRSGHTVTQNFREFIQTDAVLHEGNSGGALVDSNGYLIGINNANFKTLDSQRRVVDVNGIFFAVPYSLARRVMDEIIESGRATHGQLGFTGGIDPNVTGVVVTNVVAGGPADLGGLKQFDIILSINQFELDTLDQTFDMIAKSSPGEQLELSVSRDGKVISIQVVVGEATQ